MGTKEVQTSLFLEIKVNQGQFLPLGQSAVFKKELGLRVLKDSLSTQKNCCANYDNFIALMLKYFTGKQIEIPDLKISEVQKHIVVEIIQKQRRHMFPI